MTNGAPAEGAEIEAAGIEAAGIEAASNDPGPGFAHGSEAEMARILDFYGVRWEYEPRTFPILWNLDGEVVESFSPDFYLPDLELYLELTTLKQRLVRKKNRKLRRLRELYPDIRIKLFYARDFRAMMLKYGRLALADSLSGTLGQVVPDRAPEADTDGSVERDEALDDATAQRGARASDGVDAGPPARAGRGASRSRSRRRRAAAARSAAAAGSALDPGSTAGMIAAAAGGPHEEEQGPA